MVSRWRPRETAKQRRERWRRQKDRHVAEGWVRIRHGTIHGGNMGCPCKACGDRRKAYKQERQERWDRALLEP